MKKRDEAQADKLEKKLNVRLGGYMARSEALMKQIAEAYEEYESSQIEYESFVNLQIAEKAAIPGRVDALQLEVDRLARRENELQRKYKELTDVKETLLASF